VTDGRRTDGQTRFVNDSASTCVSAYVNINSISRYHPTTNKKACIKIHQFSISSQNPKVGIAGTVSLRKWLFIE